MARREREKMKQEFALGTCTYILGSVRHHVLFPFVSVSGFFPQGGILKIRSGGLGSFRRGEWE